MTGKWNQKRSDAPNQPKITKNLAQAQKGDPYKHLNDDKFVPRVQSVIPPKLKNALIQKLKN